MPTTLKCSNCGASISPHQARCDYCGLFFDLPDKDIGHEADDQGFDQHIAELRTRLETEVEQFKPQIYEGYTITKELDQDDLTLYFWGEKTGGTLKFESNNLDAIHRKINHYEKSGPKRQRLIRAYNRSGIY